MVELRWVERESRAETLAVRGNRMPIMERVLQYRIYLVGTGLGWDEWRDVPTVIQQTPDSFDNCAHEHVCSDGMCLICGEGSDTRAQSPIPNSE